MTWLAEADRYSLNDIASVKKSHWGFSYCGSSIKETEANKKSRYHEAAKEVSSEATLPIALAVGSLGMYS